MISPLRDPSSGKIDFKLRRGLYKKYRIEGFCAYDSAIKAGYTRTTALTKGKKLDEAIGIPMSRVLSKVGVTDDKLALKIREGLDASKDSEPLHMVQHKYLETALRLKGHLDNEGSSQSGPTLIQMNFNLEALPEGYNGETIEVEAIQPDAGENSESGLQDFSPPAVSFENPKRPEDS